MGKPPRFVGQIECPECCTHSASFCIEARKVRLEILAEALNKSRVPG